MLTPTPLKMKCWLSISIDPATGMVKGGRRPVVNKIKTETRRLATQIFDICRLRQEKIIPFDHPGERAPPPHTQRRENAL